MELKKGIICPHCQGNGFKTIKQTVVQIWNFGISYKKVKQCTTCNSEGELKYDTAISNVHIVNNGTDHRSHSTSWV